MEAKSEIDRIFAEYKDEALSYDECVKELIVAIGKANDYERDALLASTVAASWRLQRDTTRLVSSTTAIAETVNQLIKLVQTASEKANQLTRKR